MVVGGGREFYQDFSYNAYPRLLNIFSRQLIEIADDPFYISHKFHHTRIAGGQGFDADFFPFFMELVGGAFPFLIGPGGIQYPHEHIAVNDGLQRFYQHRRRIAEAGIGFHAVGVDGNYRHLGHSGLFQGAADKTDVVGGTAASAGLAHKNGRFVQIVFSRQQRVHDLTDYDQRGIAGVVVDVF